MTEELRAAHEKLRRFTATVKQGRTTHEVQGYAQTLDQAEQAMFREFGTLLGRSHRFIGVRWDEESK